MGYNIYDEIVEMDMTIQQLEDLKGFIENAIKDKQGEDISDKSYPVMFLCKDDLLSEYENNKKAVKIIKKLTDEQMKEIMSKINDSLCDTGDIWLHLKTHFEDKFLKW